MKLTRGTTLLLLILVISIVHALPSPDALGQQVEKGQQTIEQVGAQIPITSEGKLDEGRLAAWGSSADKKIASINNWLADNASWLKIVFGMVPEVSWLFAFNFFLILWAFSLLFGAMPEYFFPESKNTGQILGLMGVVILVRSKAIYYFAHFVIFIVDTWWFKLIVIFIALLLVYLSQWLSKYGAVRKEKHFKDQEKLDRTILHKEVEGLKKGSEN